MDENEEKALLAILRKDCRYPAEACRFVANGVQYTIHSVKKAGKTGLDRHVTGQELLRGILEFAVIRFGFLAPEVFSYWNFKTSRDIGNTVYIMIGGGLLAASPNDRLEDFDGIDDLDTALRQIIQNGSHQP